MNYTIGLPLPQYRAFPALTAELWRSTEWSLSGSGRFAALTNVVEFVGDPGDDMCVADPDIRLYDRQNELTIELPFNNNALAERAPSVSGSGRFIAYSTNASGGGDIKLYDRKTGNPYCLCLAPMTTCSRRSTLAGCRSALYSLHVQQGWNQRIYLYDREAQALVTLPKINLKTAARSSRLYIGRRHAYCFCG